MRNSRQAMPVFATVLFLIQACSSCEEDSDEAQIRKLIEAGAASAEKHQVGEVMQLVTKDFAVQSRGMDRQSTKGMLFVVFKRYKRFKVHYPRPSVEIDTSLTNAHAEFPFAIVREGTKSPDLSDLYENPKKWLDQVASMADVYYMKLDLVKTDDTWLVRQADVDGYRGIGEI